MCLEFCHMKVLCSIISHISLLSCKIFPSLELTQPHTQTRQAHFQMLHAIRLGLLTMSLNAGTVIIDLLYVVQFQMITHYCLQNRAVTVIVASMINDGTDITRKARVLCCRYCSMEMIQYQFGLGFR